MLENLLPAMLAHVGNQGNVGNQNGNVVNENVQENVRNVLVNGNRVRIHQKYMKTVKNKQARTRERKSEQKPKAKPGKVKSSVYSSQSWYPHNDQTATIEAPMIRRNDWLRLKDWRARQEARRIQGRL
ncbi:hypothetical protein Tco_0470942 [Tanacetum coccineum]